MLKIKKIVIYLLCFVLYLAMNTTVYSSKTNTTNDLRELMGMKRLEDEGLNKEILRLLSLTYKEEQWNELVEGLKDNIDFELKEFVEKEENYIKAKEELKESFCNNEDINQILELYIEYDTKNSLRGEQIYKNNYKLELLDTSDIETKLKYIESILYAAEDTVNIGVIGKAMNTFSKDNLLLTSVFGESRNIHTGKLEKNNGITIAIPNETPIYSQFHGKVTKVNHNSVEITTGNSLILTYKNITPTVRLNQNIKQYAELGTTKDNTMEFYVNLNTIYIDPLFLYGTRSQKWYDNWINSYPGSTYNTVDYSKLLDEIPKIEQPEEIKGSTYINEKNEEESILFQGDNYYETTPDNIVIEKTVPGLIQEVVE